MQNLQKMQNSSPFSWLLFARSHLQNPRFNHGCYDCNFVVYALNVRCAKIEWKKKKILHALSFKTRQRRWLEFHCKPQLNNKKPLMRWQIISIHISRKWCLESSLNWCVMSWNGRNSRNKLQLQSVENILSQNTSKLRNDK